MGQHLDCSACEFETNEGKGKVEFDWFMMMMRVMMQMRSKGKQKETEDAWKTSITKAVPICHQFSDNVCNSSEQFAMCILFYGTPIGHTECTSSRLAHHFFINPYRAILTEKGLNVLRITSLLRSCICCSQMIKLSCVQNPDPFSVFSQPWNAWKWSNICHNGWWNWRCQGIGRSQQGTLKHSYQFRSPVFQVTKCLFTCVHYNKIRRSRTGAVSTWSQGTWQTCEIAEYGCIQKSQQATVLLLLFQLWLVELSKFGMFN